MNGSFYCSILQVKKRKQEGRWEAPISTLKLTAKNSGRKYVRKMGRKKEERWRKNGRIILMFDPANKEEKMEQWGGREKRGKGKKRGREEKKGKKERKGGTF